MCRDRLSCQVTGAVVDGLVFIHDIYHLISILQYHEGEEYVFMTVFVAD